MVTLTRSFPFALMLILLAGVPASAETYYQAPAGPGPMIPRTDLILPSVNSDALRSTKELINDQSPTNDQAFLGLARALNHVCVDGQCGAQEARLILSFSPKINGSPKLIFEQEFPRFHLLYPAGAPFWVGWGPVNPGPSACQGGPCPANVTTVADEEHPTTHNLFMGILLPWPNAILSGQLMEVLIDYVPGQRNRMWVVVERGPPGSGRGRPHAKR